MSDPLADPEIRSAVLKAFDRRDRLEEHRARRHGELAGTLKTRDEALRRLISNALEAGTDPGDPEQLRIALDRELTRVQPGEASGLLELTDETLVEAAQVWRELGEQER